MAHLQVTAGGISYFLEIPPVAAQNPPDGGQLGSGRNLRIFRIPKSVGSGTFPPLSGGLRAQNREFAILCDPPMWHFDNFGPKSALGPSKRSKIEKTKSASFLKLVSEKFHFGFFPLF